MAENGEIIQIHHGNGGLATFRLIADVFRRRFSNPVLDAGNDYALLPEAEGRWVTATDAHVASPLFFPGGDIGSLAVCGTVNDVAMSGAKILSLTSSFIIEEGLPLETLEAVAESMAAAAKKAGVSIVAGDTRVVERGKADKLFISTAGFGRLPVLPASPPAGNRASPGDAVIVSGPVGDHGATLWALRKGITFATPLLSDVAPLNGLVAELMGKVPDVHVLRDPTRGGLAATLHEICAQSKTGMELEEEKIPLRQEVASLCATWGLDPLYLPCEGRLVALVPGEFETQALNALRSHPLGREAATVGRVTAEDPETIRMHTAYSGMRLVNWLYGELLPRIC